MRSKSHDILFEPVTIGPVVARNRFYQVPHCSGFGSDKPRIQAAHRGVKAEGGWGVVCTEYAPVSRDSDDSPDVSSQILDEQDITNLSLMAETCHQHGALAGLELAHVGLHANLREARWPAAGPSQVASETQPGLVAKEMELSDIKRIQGDFVAAAIRGQRAGFDVIYVFGGATHLMTQFLSPYYNKRTDEYGGSLENRSRMWIETLEGVREAVGETCAIAARICVDLVPEMEPEEFLAFIRAADHLVDLWDVTIGTMALWSHDSGASRFFKAGHWLDLTRRAREATDKPIVVVGRFTDPDQMASLVRGGDFDLVGAARPSIADPFLPVKVQRGDYSDIRECIGCNICAARSISGHLSCTQNPTAGEEFRRGWHPERVPAAHDGARDVLVVGAGPAGLECAVTLGKRGFRRVHLVEGDKELGGSVRWISRLPGLAEWSRVISYRASQLKRLKNVEVIPGTRLDLEDVMTYGADLVVCATGSRWANDGLNPMTHAPIPGWDTTGATMLAPEDILVGGLSPAPGSRVVIIDGDGYFMGASLAELLAAEGHQVTILSMWESVAPLCDATLEGDLLRRRLFELGVSSHTGVTVERLEAGRVIASHNWGQALELAYDAIVMVTQRRSEDELYRSLIADPERLRAEEITQVFRTGDCVAPRLIADAIFDGHRLAREIETPTPAWPLAHLRERATVGQDL